MSEKKMVRRSIAIALGVVCIVVVAGLIGAFAYYMPVINDKDKTISSLNSNVTNLQNKMDDLNSSLVDMEAYFNATRYDGLVGYWKFDEGNGNKTVDSSGNNNNGTLTGPMWIKGEYGDALSFDGTGSYVAIPALFSSSPDSVTVSAWIDSSLSNVGMIVYDGQNAEFVLHNGNLDFSEPANTVGLQVKLTDGYWYHVYSPPITPNVWHNVIGVWSKGESLKIYVDGNLVNVTSIPDDYMYAPGSSWTSSIGDYAGPWGGSANPHSFFNGTIDNVMIYNRALSAEEVKAQYLLPPP